MAPKSTQQNNNPTFRKNVIGAVGGSLLTGALSATPRSPQTTAASSQAVPRSKPNAGKSVQTGKAGTSSVESAEGEIEIPAKLPLIAAIDAMGGREALLAAHDLSLVVTKFPKTTATTVGNENRFVQGLEGKIGIASTKTVENPGGKAVTVILAKNDTFRIRWDFVPGEAAVKEDRKQGTLAKDAVVGKGLHVNAEFGIGSSDKHKSKIAFMPTGVGPLVDEPTARNGVRFDQIVKDQSTFLGYDTKPNVRTTHTQKPNSTEVEAKHEFVVFSVEDRIHPPSSKYTPQGEPETPDASEDSATGETKKLTPAEKAVLEKVIAAAARKLAERWAEMAKTGNDQGTLAGSVAEATKANDEEKAKIAAEEAAKKKASGGSVLSGSAAGQYAQGSTAGQIPPATAAAGASQRRPPGNAQGAPLGKR